MTKEILRMQMLAGIITEGQYKEKMEEVDSMGKVGKSYPAPGSTEIILTSQQQKAWEDIMIKSFYELADDDGEEEALYNLPYASEEILSNILIGKKPNYYWDDDFEREDELERKGIDLDEMERKADEMYEKFTKGSTNNPKIKDIQDIYNSFT